jgi:gas vesicle protein
MYFYNDRRDYFPWSIIYEVFTEDVDEWSKKFEAPISCEMESEIKDVIAKIKDEIKDEMAKIKDETKDEMAKIKDEMKDEITKLKNELKQHFSAEFQKTRN